MTAAAYAWAVAQRSSKAQHKYRQIAGDLRTRIEKGEHPVGARLPTKPELAEAYGASEGTIGQALAILADLGMVETQQGSGTFVLRDHPGESEAQQLGEQVAALRAQVAELARRVEAAQDASLREIVGRIQANLADLYGKTGFTYPQDEATPERRPDRMVRHG